MEQVANAGAIKYDTTGVHIVALRVHRRETTLGCELGYVFALSSGDGTSQNEDCISMPFARLLESAFDVLWTTYV